MSSPDTSVSTTRRRILGWGGASALGGLACYLGWPKGGSSLAQVTKNGMASLPATIPSEPEKQTIAFSKATDRENFLQHLNSEFHLDSVGGSCKLIEVSPEQKMTSPAGKFTSFSLLFIAPRDLVAESQIHQLSHDRLGKLDLFISPVGSPKEHVYLEAICSQRV
jgi:hypothetical protein